MDALVSAAGALLLAMAIIPGGIILPIIAIVSLASRILGVLKHPRPRFCFMRRDGHELADDGSIITPTHGRKEIQ